LMVVVLPVVSTVSQSEVDEQEALWIRWQHAFAVDGEVEP